MALAAPSREQRQLIVLFADMVGFTAISERLGEEGTFTLIQPIYEFMAEAVKEQGGSVKGISPAMASWRCSKPPRRRRTRLARVPPGAADSRTPRRRCPRDRSQTRLAAPNAIGVNAVVTQIRGENTATTSLGDT